MTHNELITAHEQTSEQQELRNTRKKLKRNRRVPLKVTFVFTTEEISEITQAADAETIARSAKKRPCKSATQGINSEDEEIILENDSSESELDCIILASIH